MDLSRLKFFKSLITATEFWFLFLLCWSNLVQAGDSQISSNQSCHSVSERTCQIAHELKKGINLGNMLEAPNEGDWKIRLDPAYIELLKGKFQSVRVPVRWSNHASLDDQAKIDAFFLKRVTKAVSQLLANGHYVIINVHHYNQLNGKRLSRNEFRVDDKVLELRLINIWKQLAAHYKGYSDRLIFEVLNEPTGRLTHQKWNQLQKQLVRAIREVEPRRTIMITPRAYRPIHQLSKLNVPEDSNLIVALHQYTPFTFTHQGIKYLPMKLPSGITCCSSKQQEEIVSELDIVTRWNQQHGYPVHLGEFGSYQAADMVSRVNYTRFMVDELEKRGIGWAYWEFGSNFGVYDIKEKSWRKPLYNALLLN